ncbi:MAG: cytochrome bd ubiquinol oxidase subunit [Actinomycetota bacterium]|jgi:cytochrome bd ubiquinol oxidase subunit I|nr:cytochrome bd ubiquinol oxidase, subunit [Glaciihabitans sp.]MDQ1543927.1 cytochrome bd ubiquinol oxidase subunit [Actinomycetota bacterium]
MVSLIDLSRWQFALTVVFHMTFPSITVGMSVFLSVIYAMYWHTQKPVYLQMFRFWRRIFAVGFALGVVAGAVITFQMGLNWGVFGAKTGPIIGPIIGMEVVTAFFVEAGFIGILLYGDGRVRHITMFASTVMVAIGTILSSTWILAANSWMQTPEGYAVKNGQYVPTNWAAAIFTPAFAWRFPHMLLAVLISGAIFIAGIAAYYLVKNRAHGVARRSLSIALGVVALLLPVQLLVGDGVAGNVDIPYQMSKLEAIEGNWQNGNTGWMIFDIPDQAAAKNIFSISIPWLGSAISKDPTGKTATPGLDNTPAADRPDMAATFWGFRAMFFSSLFMFATAFIGVVLRLRNRLWESKRFHKYVLWTTPMGIFAIIGGWVTSEAGRQPWVVFGLLRTSAAVSKLAPGTVLFSVIGFSLIYLILLGSYIAYIVHTVKIGPERDDPRVSPDLTPELIVNAEKSNTFAVAGEVSR